MGLHLHSLPIHTSKSIPVTINSPIPTPFRTFIPPLNPIPSRTKRSNTPPLFSAPSHCPIFAYKGSGVEFDKLESAMTITPAVRISDGKLVVEDRVILTNVPENVVVTSGSDSGPVEGMFVGAVFDEKSSRHVVSLGTLREVRFMACFRFKLWWMSQMMGDKGRDIPHETQFLILETKNGSQLGGAAGGGGDENKVIYTVFLPLIEHPFRACLQGNSRDELELCLESGDSATLGSDFTHSVYIHAGTDPFATITAAVNTVKTHLKTFRQRHEKKLPGFVDWFGWCTWDAFYQEVTQEGVEAGLNTLAAGGIPPKFIIIDDGWQSVGSDPKEESGEEKPLMRLTAIKENSKFQTIEDPTLGIKNIVNFAKQKHGVKYVYVWHAITGYWGGVRPGEKGMEQYGSILKYPDISKGVMENEPSWKTDPLAVHGLGLMNPRSVYKFYDDFHSYLASAGVDGLKVDVQSILETLGAGHGGRVEITQQYHQALDASVAKNFPDNGCIACMSHNTDALYCSKQTAVIRACDDFYPRDPISHTIHISAVAYNSVFLGEFMQPDWDMFHSLHLAAEYHGSVRALSGGPVYVSDAPGKHDFELLRKLVLPDGSILRARLPGRPTKDCLFSDPSRDGVSLLKIWNVNKYTGVLGVYNCQGAAWNAVERKNTFHRTGTEALTGYVRGGDVHSLSEVALDSNWSGDSAVYSHNQRKLTALPYNAAMPISLKILEHDIFTITPIKVLAPGFSFAPLGLVDMFNAGGAIEGLKYETKAGFQGEDKIKNSSTEPVGVVSIEVRGCGRFGAYSSAKPRKCRLGGNVVDFTYDLDSGLVTLNLDDMPAKEQRVHMIEVEL
ncbi:PREDICTED: probable galactinol--sucrose galactosyltransferase 6 isoform X2 [Ipomoea nil]|uniref:probable galactinol--sucrose galactosyltransferase 6 isoform X2 n=1 Tax=Ipomoea nil TaxID=35883 RepID=UPI000901657E|nr:PREDICTED: probable galactinol--sucrose galactosyltransferase 6 isoform X2 [Ipomoea nil]